MVDGPAREFPLFWAATSRSLSILRNLIAAGADVSQCTASNWTALHAAAHHNHSGLIKELLKSEDADVDCLTNEEQTPLHLAAAQGHAATVKVLLREKADITSATDRVGSGRKRWAFANGQDAAGGAIQAEGFGLIRGFAQLSVGG
jgi:ankyrin repeat protein